MQSAHYYCQISIVLQFFFTEVQKTPKNINFHENPSSARRVVPRGQMDRRANRHDKDNGRFSQVCELA